ICSATFQALGKGTLSLYVSVIRQLVVLIPAAWLLSLSGNVNLVWFSFPIAEIASLILCAVFLRKCYREILKPMMAVPAAAVQ
ncbi:MAG: MATE family efflux transporter, partial [Oscillospiraceae bacterium]|nr:MATE family efflux transporter [Oscillospiraceae bacterium]